MESSEKNQGGVDWRKCRRKRSREIFLDAAPFERESFADCVMRLVSEDLHTRKTSRKPHLRYLAKYLCKIGARTIIIEEPYYDRHIFRDYWALSADAASSEEHACARMHFFKKDMHSLQNKKRISLGELSAFIDDKSKQKRGKKESYLGFIVIVLNSEKMIGTTCLVPPQSSTIVIPTTVKYQVNLVGHGLPVKSLAFREQDTVTSACATCALWSTLQKTSRKFGHESLSPGEITARALKLYNRKDRLPMDMGLSNADIASAINSISGLRANVANLKHSPPGLFAQVDESSERSTCISLMLNLIVPLLDHGVPVILTMKSPGGGAIKKVGPDGKPEVHAVSIVGYEITTGKCSGEETTPVDQDQKAGKILELIAHDDNVGPFTRLRVENFMLYCVDRDVLEDNSTYQSPHTVIGICHDSIKPDRFLPSKKSVADYLLLLNELVELVRKENPHSFLTSVEIGEVKAWETRFRASNKYKRKILGLKKKMDEKNENKLHETLKRFLSSSLPDYILVISVKGPVAHDLVFSMAGPWQMEFIQVVPYKLETLELLALVRQKAKEEAWLQNETIQGSHALPIIKQIIQHS